MHLKFLQINIWDGGRQWDELTSFIAKEDPDILTVQEAYNGADPNSEPRFRTINEFQKRFSFPFCFFVPEFLDERMEGFVDQGNAIFSKFPITTTNAIDLFGTYGPWTQAQEATKNYGDVPRRLAHAAIDVGGVTVDVFSIHGIVDNRGDFDSPQRLEMSKRIIEQISDKTHVIMAGDFNIQPNTQTIRNIEQHLANAFKDELTSTYNMRRKERPIFAECISDMLFVSPSVTVREHTCPDIDVSDHRPLVATLEI